MKTILIAEDEGTIALNLKKIVEKMGIKVLEIVKKGEDLSMLWKNLFHL